MKKIVIVVIFFSLQSIQAFAQDKELPTPGSAKIVDKQSILNAKTCILWLPVNVSNPTMEQNPGRLFCGGAVAAEYVGAKYTYEYGQAENLAYARTVIFSQALELMYQMSFKLVFAPNQKPDAVTQNSFVFIRTNSY